MMKRFAGIVMSAMLLVVMCAAPVSAADFELTDSNPKDGYEKVEAKNVMVKLFFSEDVSGEETQKANKDKIALKDSDGKAVDFEILYDSKDSKKICRNRWWRSSVFRTIWIRKKNMWFPLTAA